MVGIEKQTSAPDAMTDELIQRCRQKDEDAWRELFQSNFDFVYRVARRLGTREDEIEDVCQDAFIVAFNRFDSFTYGRFTTWLYRIVANLVTARHRRHRVRTALFAIFGRNEHVVPTPLRVLEARDAERITAEILSRMSANRREVFVLYELENLSHEEIALHLGVNVATVWKRLHYARRDFARRVQKLGLKDEGGV